jgi:serine/threonine-protein kinase ATR
MSNSLKLELPEDGFLVSPSLLSGDSAPFTYQSVSFTIRDPDHAAFLVVHLFSTISELLSQKSDIPALRSTADNLVWFLQGLQKLWMSQNIWESLPMLYERAGAIRLKILEALRRAVKQIVISRYGNSRSECICLLAIRCVGDVLKKPMAQINQTAEDTLAGIFLELSHVAGGLPAIGEALREQLCPLVVTALAEKESPLASDLRVRIFQPIIYRIQKEAGTNLILGSHVVACNRL